MHAEAWNYLISIRGRFTDISKLRVVEFGAHDVNGSPRQLFKGCKEYIGIDPWHGLGVDVIGKAQDFITDEPFDICISSETLEHDPDPKGQIEAAGRALRSGGKLIITAAGPEREAHRCDGSLGDMQGEYYANIEPDEMECLLKEWKFVEIQHNKAHGDIYAVAVKP